MNIRMSEVYLTFNTANRNLTELFKLLKYTILSLTGQEFEEKIWKKLQELPIYKNLMHAY